jgi:hypothetical protein
VVVLPNPPSEHAVTRIIVEVARDGDGRLHGTVEPDGPDVSRADFTGVI